MVWYNKKCKCWTTKTLWSAAVWIFVLSLEKHFWQPSEKNSFIFAWILHFNAWLNLAYQPSWYTLVLIHDQKYTIGGKTCNIGRLLDSKWWKYGVKECCSSVLLSETDFPCTLVNFSSSCSSSPLFSRFLIYTVRL